MLPRYAVSGNQHIVRLIGSLSEKNRFGGFFCAFCFALGSIDNLGRQGRSQTIARRRVSYAVR